MPMAGPLGRFPLWLLFGITIVVLLLAVEGGYRLGGRRRRGGEPEDAGYVQALVSSSMAFHNAE